MNIDRRQFMICNKKLIRNDFLNLELEGGFWLNYHKDLKMQKLGQNILLGHAFSVHSDYPVTEDKRYSVEEQIKKWGGRFLVYSHGKIYTDATNSIGLFYIWKDDLRAISSSIHLLVEEYRLPKINEFELAYRQRSVTTWDFYPGPYTPYKEIKRLMQYEKINLFAQEFVEAYTHEWNKSDYQGMSGEKLTQCFIEYAIHMLREIQKEYDGIYVPLTGGVDSRLICALCKKAGISFTAYTEQRSVKTHGVELKKADRYTPKKVADKIGIEWIWCKRKTWNEEKWENILTHSMGMVRNTNLYTYAYDQYPPSAKEKNIILHGSVFGISNEVYNKHMNEDFLELDFQKKNLHQWLKGMIKCSDVHKNSLDKWVEDIQEKGNHDIGWVNRFYWEQRIGSWLNDINQAMDIIDFDRISLANNFEMISVLFSFPKEMRKKKEHELMMIKQSASELLDIPFNYDYLSERVGREIKRFGKRYRSLKRKIKGG